MRYILIAGYLMLSIPVFSQNITLEKMDMKGELQENGPHKNYYKYVIGNYILYNGRYENNLLYHIVDTTSGKVVLENDPSESDAMIRKPVFFSNPPGSLIVILIEEAAEYSWGQEVILIKNDMVKNLGYLSYAADNENTSSIASYCSLSTDQNTVIMTFENITIINLKDGSTLNGKDLKFELTSEGILRNNQ